ncbi:MAG: galactose-1-phosphate uridylyltransferase [Chloroflexi bacterium]|nr:galactose-1-phosphate uridylyltransferase [Chloroflexota bacterium]
MSELRQDPTTHEWVIMAPERGSRPLEAPRRDPEPVPEWDASCPFCPGNESRTPPEVCRIGGPDEWAVRVVPNRFPALNPDGAGGVAGGDLFFRRRPGYGVHEVIIEDPRHNAMMALMAPAAIAKVLQAYQRRYNALKVDRRLKFITIFKNHGWGSGTSLAHPHSQLVATPIMATYYRRKSGVAYDYYSDTGRCLYCDLLDKELAGGERIVAATGQFVVLHPFASRAPYETWIVPRKHYASFGLFPGAGLAELAGVLRESLYCLYTELNDPAFNFAIDTSTTDFESDPYYHWHIRIVPRLTTAAGFEIGSGIYINIALPEETAKRIRGCRAGGLDSRQAAP